MSIQLSSSVTNLFDFFRKFVDSVEKTTDKVLVLKKDTIKTLFIFDKIVLGGVQIKPVVICDGITLTHKIIKIEANSIDYIVCHPRSVPEPSSATREGSDFTEIFENGGVVVHAEKINKLLELNELKKNQVRKKTWSVDALLEKCSFTFAVEDNKYRISGAIPFLVSLTDVNKIIDMDVPSLKEPIETKADAASSKKKASA